MRYEPMGSIAAVLLAAGASTRMGTPKQLLPFREWTLLEHAAATVLEAGFAPLVVVLGAHAERIRPVVQGLPAWIVENAAWAEGMGGSVRAGVAAVCRSATPEGVLLALGDQPLVTAGHLRELRDAFERSAARIVASRYASTVGVPAIFGKSLLPELLTLGGDEGARKVVARHAAETVALDLPEAAVDVDTPGEYEGLGGVR